MTKLLTVSKPTFESALQKRARIATGKYDLRVICEGYEAYTDCESEIVLPSLPPELDHETALDLDTYLDHEIGHIERTDMKYINKVGFIHELHQKMWNMIEDPWQEGEKAKADPGCGPRFDRLNAKWRAIHDEQWEKIPAGFRIISNVRALYEGRDMRLDDDIKPAFTSRARALILTLRLATGTREIHSITRKICDEMEKALRQAHENPPPPPEQEEDEQEQGEAGEQGEGDEQGDADGGDEGDDEQGDDADGDDEGDGGKGEGGEEGAGGDEESDEGESAGDEGGRSEGESAGDEDGRSEGESADGDDREGESGEGEGGEEGADGEGGQGAKGGDGGDGEPKRAGSLDPDDLKDEDHYETDVPQDIHSYIAKVCGELLEQQEEKNEEAIKKWVRNDDIAKTGYHIPASTRYDELIDLTKERPTAAYTAILRKVGTLASKLASEIEELLVSRRDEHWETEQETGRINRRALPKLAVDRGYRTPFQELVTEDVTDVDIEFVIDHSGSMGAYGKMDVARETTAVFAEALSSLNIPFEIGGFATGGKMVPATPGANRLENLKHFVYKTFDSTNLQSIAAMQAQGCNCDGESIRFFADRLMQRPGSRKIMFVLSDGMPSCGVRNHALLNKDLVDAVKQLTAAGVEVVAFGIMSDAVATFYSKHVIVNDPADLTKEVAKTLKRLLTED